MKKITNVPKKIVAAMIVAAIAVGVTAIETNSVSGGNQNATLAIDPPEN